MVLVSNKGFKEKANEKLFETLSNDIQARRLYALCVVCVK